MLLRDICGLSGNEVYAGKDIKIPPEKTEIFEAALQRLSSGEPVQYVIGQCEFCSRMFICRQPVLIPRPETEELVDWILRDREDSTSAVRLLDMGTGSGCIALSLACERPNWQVEAWDILPEALSLARENAGRLGADVRFLKKDLFAELNASAHDCFDVIVSNPPYVCESEAETMSDRVLRYESPQALFVPDKHPLRYYEALAALGRRILSENGRIFLEINSRFGEETKSLLESYGYVEVELRRDLYGRDRMIRARV